MTVEKFQARVRVWIESCFPNNEIANRGGRTVRFVEESLELAQAAGCSKEDVLSLVEYVYGRPDGVVQKEVGGVLVTLAGLCGSFDIDMNNAGEDELQRNWIRLQDIRRKHAESPIGSPLPE